MSAHWLLGSLTAILGGLFDASVTFSQRLFVALTGEKSDGASVLATLIVVSLFTPIKSGLQALADRRFKPSAQRVAALKELGIQTRAVVETIDLDLSTRRLLEKWKRGRQARADSARGAVSLDRL